MISDAAAPLAEGACWRLPRRIALLVLIAVAASAAVAAPARAESDESKAKARARMADGVKLLDRKDYAAALAAFEEAYALVPSAKIQFNIGVAKRGLGRKAEALEAFEQFLEMSPFAPPASRAEAEKARDDLRQKVGFLKINVDEAGAAISVDGRGVGQSPLHKLVAVELGAHDVAARLEGVTRRQKVNAPVGGQTTTVWFQMVEEKRPAAEAPPPPVPAPPKAVEPEAPPPRAVRTAESPAEEIRQAPPPRRERDVAPRATGRSGWQIALPLIAGGATLLAGGAGLATLVIRNDKASQFNACIKASTSSSGNMCGDLKDQAAQWQQWEAAAFVAAGVLAVTTITLVIVTSPSDPPPAVAFGCAPVVSSTPGVTCSARF